MPRASGSETVLAEGSLLWKFELEMHEAQQEIWNSDARFKVIAAGRRFGKTLLAVAWLLVIATASQHAIVWWVAPTNAQARMAMRTVARVIPKRHREVNLTLMEITLSNGATIAFKSGERIDNLRGEGLDGVVLDEAAFLSEEAWTMAIRPALSDRNGKALLISTYDGENWFYDLRRYASDPDNKLWEGWEFPTSCNPWIPQAEIDEARRNLPTEVFEQEYEASPLSFAGAVFDSHLLNEAYELGRDFEMPKPVVSIDPMQPDHLKFLMVGCEAGLDWGWLNTALEINKDLGDGRLAWVHEELYQRVELVERCHMIADQALAWNITTIYADAAGATENVTLAKILEQRGCQAYVQPVPFNVWKVAGIATRNFYLQNKRELITSGCKNLLANSKGYHYAPATDENKLMPAKGKDHDVDAATAFYASRAYELGDVFDDKEGKAA